MKKYRKLLTILLTAAMALTLSACGGNSQGTSDSSTENKPSASTDTDADKTAAVSGDITYTWGSMSGLYGDVEVSYNDNGTVASKSLINAATGNPFVRLDYEYGSWPDETSVSTVYTRAVNGVTFYSMGYSYQEDGDSYYISNLSGLDYLKDSESYPQTSTTVTLNKQGGIDSYTFNDYYGYYQYYWITECADGVPVSTTVYNRDGYEDTEMDLTWITENGKVTGAEDRTHVYTAEYSEDGHTLTLLCDKSDDSKTAFTKYVLTYSEDGCLVSGDYEDNNGTKDRVVHAEFTREENGKPVKSTYEDSDYNGDFTYTFDEKGNLASQNHLLSSIGSGDIGARSYTWYEDGGIETITYYNDADPNPEEIDHVETFSEDGHLTERDRYTSGQLHSLEKYNADGTVIYDAGYVDDEEGKAYLRYENNYTDDGYQYEQYSYFPDGGVDFHSLYNEHHLPILMENGEEAIAEAHDSSSYGNYLVSTMEDNVYTEICYTGSDTLVYKRVYTYGDDSYSYEEYDSDGKLLEDMCYTDRPYEY